MSLACRGGGESRRLDRPWDTSNRVRLDRAPTVLQISNRALTGAARDDPARLHSALDDRIHRSLQAPSRRCHSLLTLQLVRITGPKTGVTSRPRLMLYRANALEPPTAKTARAVRQKNTENVTPYLIPQSTLALTLPAIAPLSNLVTVNNQVT